MSSHIIHVPVSRDQQEDCGSSRHDEAPWSCNGSDIHNSEPVPGLNPSCGKFNIPSGQLPPVNVLAQRPLGQLEDKSNVLYQRPPDVNSPRSDTHSDGIPTPVKMTRSGRIVHMPARFRD